jgi:allantoin racemase
MANFLAINPNSNVAMTQSMKRTIGSCIHPGHRFDVVRIAKAAQSLESYYDYGISSYYMSKLLDRLELNEIDGILLACFGDPGLYALKETVSAPVVGIAEASLSAGLLIGSSIAIITASEKAVPMMKNMVGQYGLSSRLAGVYSLDMAVLDLEADPDATIHKLLQAGQLAMEQGKADVLVLGCAGFTGFGAMIEQELRIPVIDPVKTGFKLLEAIVESGLTVSKRGMYAARNP